MSNKTEKPEFPDSPSTANQEKARHIKEAVKNDIVAAKRQTLPYFLSVFRITIVLPSLQTYPEDFKKFLDNVLFDRQTQIALESRKVLNWCRTCKELIAVKVLGDGNCLNHAASFSMWGISDDNLLLRRLIYSTLVTDEENGNAFMKRWMLEKKQTDQNIPGDVRLDTGQWKQEWEEVMNMASDQPNHHTGPNQLPFNSLEEIHVFVLANVLRRSIVVLAEPVIRHFDDTSLAPNNFCGIYLPLLCNPDDCEKTPIVLAYDMNHFAPLLSQKDPPGAEHLAQNAMFAVPLVTEQFEQLRIHFLLPEEEKKASSLLEKYLRLTEIPLTKLDGLYSVLSAKLPQKPIDDGFNLIKDYFQMCEDVYRRFTDSFLKNDPQRLMKIRNEEVAVKAVPGESNVNFNLEVNPPPSNPSVPSAGEQQPFIPDPNDLYSGERQIQPPGFGQIGAVGELARQPHGPTVYQPSIVNQRCATPGCKYMCSVNTGQYCYNCYPKALAAGQIIQPPHGNQSHEVPHMPRQIPHVRSESTKCLFTGCKLYGEADHMWMCSEHYKKALEDEREIERQREVGQTRVSISTQTSLPINEMSAVRIGLTQQRPLITSTFTHGHRCKSTRCQNSGNDRLRGLCNECFLKQEGIGTQSQSPGTTTPAPKMAYNQCKTTDCKFYGTPERNGYCTSCCEKYGIRANSAAQHKKYVNKNVGCKVVGCQALGVSRFGGYCQDHYIVQGSSVPQPGPVPSMSVQKCKTIDCEFIGTPQQNGFCSQCYAHSAVESEEHPQDSLTSMQILELLPPTPPEELHKARTYYKCITPDCTKIGHEKAGGLCSSCYIRKYRILHGSRRIAQESIMGAAAAAPTRPPATDSGKQLCATPGCQGTRQYHNELCAVCYEEAVARLTNRPHRQRVQFASNPEMHTFQSSSTTFGSATSPLPSSVIPNGHENSQYECLNPGCHRFGHEAYNGFCDTCYRHTQYSLEASRLRSGELQRPTETRARPYEHAKVLCKTRNCQLFGSDDQYGYCSQCFYRKLDTGELQPGIDVPDPSVARQEPPRSNPAQTRARKCSSPHCDKYGDPAEHGLCHEHFLQLGRSSPTSTYPPGEPISYTYRTESEYLVGEARYGSLPSDLTQLYYTETIPERASQLAAYRQNGYSQESTFDTKMNQHVQSVKSTTGKCKNHHCTNLGNSKCRGYCNSCNRLGLGTA